VLRAFSNLIVKPFNLMSQPNIVRRNFKLLGKPVPFGRAVSRAFYSPFTSWWWMRRRSSSPMYKVKEFQLDEDFDTHAALIR